MKRPVKNFKEWSKSKSSFNLNESVQFPTDHDEIEQILRYYEIENYSIRPDGTVDVNGDVRIEKQRLIQLPVKFGIVNGIFDCSYCDYLVTLDGAPEECEIFLCNSCKRLRTLEKAPKICRNVFNCKGCYMITSLKGVPKKCEYFDCSHCTRLRSLEKSPKECKKFDCSNCISLSSLEGAIEECIYFTCHSCTQLKTLKGAPKKCNAFDCSACKNLKNLEGAPEECKNFNCSFCVNLITLEGAPEECGTFDCSRCTNLKSLKGVPKECKYFNCDDCMDLEISLDYFPKCKKIFLNNTPLEDFYKNIGDKYFIELLNAKTDFEFEKILALSYSTGKVQFEKYIKPFLKDKTISPENLKHKYRGARAAEKFIF